MRTCARCRKKSSTELLSYSKVTGLHYCMDWASCDRRFDKRLRELAKREGVVA